MTEAAHIEPSDRRERQIRILVLLLIAFGLRLGWGLSRPSDDASLMALPDQREYLELARNLLAGEGLKLSDPRFDGFQLAMRMPGYPFFLAGCGGSVTVARIAQALIDTSTVLAVFLLARAWLGHWFALTAGILAALNPFLIYFSALLLTETLFTAMLTWALVLLVYRQSVVWGALLLVASIYVRPSAILLPLVLGIATTLVLRDEIDRPAHRWWRLPVGTTILLLTLLALAPWIYRNRIVLEEWVVTTTNGGITAYDGFHPNATGASDQSFVEGMPWLRAMPEVQRDRYLRQQAQDFVRQNPKRAAQLMVIKIARTWSPMPLSTEYSRPHYIAAGLGFALPFDLLILAGLIWGNVPRSVKVLLLVPAIYFTIVHAMSVGSLRYRIPCEPALAVLAAVGLQWVVQRWIAPLPGYLRSGDHPIEPSQESTS